MIDSEECFAIWAPDGAAWTPWAKPVPFASNPLLSTDPLPPLPRVDGPGIPIPSGRAAIVVDLAGAESVLVGLALALQGFRPVPLFNGTLGPSPVVDVRALLDALGAGSQLLKTLVLRPDAPPAFLLDAQRRGEVAGSLEGRYDNRWIVFPQDFPSATFLQTRGIRDIVLLLAGTLKPAEDLAHVLLRWQQGGMHLMAVDLSGSQMEGNLHLSAPSMFKRCWYRAVALVGLRRSNVGGFGAVVPLQSGSGGFG